MNRLIILILVLAVLFLSACGSVELVDHTPEEFPAVDYPPLELPPQVFKELAELGGFDEHRFRVEVKSQFVNRSSIQALVWLDGAWLNMSGEGNGIWYYDSPDKCNEEYRYTFAVFYTGGPAIPEEPSDLTTVTVSQFGEVSWYERWQGGILGPVYTRPEVGEAKFVADAAYKNVIVVQNLTQLPQRVAFVGFDINDPNAALFDVQRPIPSTELNCGDKEEIEITYLASPDAPSVSVYMTLFIEYFWEGTWQRHPQPFNIILTGSPGPI